MQDDVLEKLEQLYHAASELDANERDAFLTQTCGADAVLRAKVETLLHQNPDSESLFAKPAFQFAGSILSTTRPMTVALGTRLGHYEVESVIGAGGMGEVYRARDLRLGRDVAIKILPPIFALDRDRMRRFEREARLLAALNHPEIATIHGLEEFDGIWALILEFVDGPTLADRLAQSAPPLDETLTLARQIAEGLEAAHGQNVIHRDLKPSNIKLGKDGRLKLLDFGLAKTMPSNPSDTDLSHDDVILGTGAYMSPEQARGKSVGKGTDIWAFGCILYELLTGQRAFPGETFSDTVACVLHQEPDWKVLPPATPATIRSLLQRCLRKDATRRLQDIGDARIEIQEALEALTSRSATAVPDTIGFSLRLRLHWVVALIFACVVGALFGWFGKQSPRSPLQAAHLVMPVVAGLDLPPMVGLALSPDDRSVVYVGSDGTTPRLYLRSMSTTETRALEGTDGASYPFFSPDGKWVAFFSARKILKVSVNGGPAVPILDTPSSGGSGGSWATDGAVFFVNAYPTGIWRVPASGGIAQPVTVLDRAKGEVAHLWPVVVPEANVLLYTVWTGPGLDEHQIVGLRLDTGERRVLIQGGATARYLSTGHLVYTRAGKIMAVSFDAHRLEVSGAAVPILDDLREGTHAADYDVSAAGSLAYVHQSPGARNRTPVWVDRKGTAHPVPGVAPAYYQNPRYSTDGRQVAFNVTASLIDVWLYDIERTTLTRLGASGSSQSPVWSPDGTRIAYRGTRKGFRNLFMRAADGTGTEQQLTTGDKVQTPWSWSPDGTIAINETDSTNERIVLIPSNGLGKPQSLSGTTFNEGKPRFSPDGRFLAYVSNESGRTEIYVQSYAGPRRRWQISTEGGQEAMWAHSGRELFYRNGDKMMVVDVRDGPTFSAPRFLFEWGFFRGEPTIDFDVTPDDQGFLMIQSSEKEVPPKEINIILNWAEDLKGKISPTN